MIENIYGQCFVVTSKDMHNKTILLESLHIIMFIKFPLTFTFALDEEKNGYVARDQLLYAL